MSGEEISEREMLLRMEEMFEKGDYDGVIRNAALMKEVTERNEYLGRKGRMLYLRDAAIMSKVASIAKDRKLSKEEVRELLEDYKKKIRHIEWLWDYGVECVQEILGNIRQQERMQGKAELMEPLKDEYERIMETYKRKFKEKADEFAKVLGIPPEDLFLNYEAVR